MTPRHIYWFSHYDLTCPSARYRGFFPLSWLSDRYPITYDFVIPERTFRGLVSFLFVYGSVLFFRRKNSLIVIQKVCSTGFYAWSLRFLVRIRRRDTIYDLDDAEQYRRPEETMIDFIRHCERVHVGSEWLKRYCLRWNNRVRVLTSPVMTRAEIAEIHEGPLRIGWVGDYGAGIHQKHPFSHKNSLNEILFPAVKKLNVAVKLFLIGVKNPVDIPPIRASFLDAPQVEIIIPERLDWTNDDWLYSMMTQFDVGVSPLLDHPFTQAKSAFKAKQYLSVGVPVIADDIGENNRFIVHGQNGFLCHTPEDWMAALQRMAIMSNGEWQRMSVEARKSAWRFSMEHYCMAFVENHLEGRADEDLSQHTLVFEGQIP